MTTVIQNVSLVFGQELEVIRSGYIEIDEGAIISAGEGSPSDSSQEARTLLNGHGLLAIPGLIDAHTHLADSILKDIGIGSSLETLVHPISGLKSKLLDEVAESEVCKAIAMTVRDMLASGITTFADFREGGLAGVQLAHNALQGTKSRALILGRPNYAFNQSEAINDSISLSKETMRDLLETIDICSGLGVSGANEYTNNAMKQMSDLAKKQNKLLGVHASESADSVRFSLENFSASEVERVLRHLKPNFLVHLTNATTEDIEKVSANHIPVVCCPRANSILGLGFPPLLELLEANVTVALGTDNVMLAPPDMFREMDYTSRMLRANRRDAGAISSKDVLKMATVNAASVLALDSKVGSIEEEKRADIAFLDLNSANLRFSKNLIASLVHRARPEDIKCVMVDGEIVHGSIPSA